MNATIARAARAAWRVVFPFALALLLVGCASSGGGGGSEDTTDEPVTGTLGGLAFTVVTGEIVQETDDGPITAPDGALIAFDKDASALGETDVIYVILTVLFEDGGHVAIAAFGTEDDEFAEALTHRQERNGNDIEFKFQEGLGGSSNGTGTYTQADGSAKLWVKAQLDDTNGDPLGSTWDPVDADYYECIGDDEGLIGSPNGNGDRLGIEFEDVELKDMDTDGLVSGGSFC